jgi:hypothetical protein
MVKTVSLGRCLAACLVLSACSPSFAPANAPTAACRTISKAQFDDARDAGATIGRAKIRASGIVSLGVGPGSSHCSKVPSGKKTCIRPNDFAIEYKLANDQLVYVLERVPINWNQLIGKTTLYFRVLEYPLSSRCFWFP